MIEHYSGRQQIFHFSLFTFHFLGGWETIDELLDSPREANGCDEIEHQAVVGITLPGDGDEEFAGNGMSHEHRGRIGTEEDEDLQDEFWHRPHHC